MIFNFADQLYSRSHPEQGQVLPLNIRYPTTQCRQVEKIQYIPKDQYRPLVIIQLSWESMIDHQRPNKWPDQVSHNNENVIDFQTLYSRVYHGSIDSSLR